MKSTFCFFCFLIYLVTLAKKMAANFYTLNMVYLTRIMFATKLVTPKRKRQRLCKKYICVDLAMPVCLLFIFMIIILRLTFYFCLTNTTLLRSIKFVLAAGIRTTL